MFFPFIIFVFNNIDVCSTIYKATLELAIPTEFNIFAGKDMLTVCRENIQLVINDFCGCNWFENVVQTIAIGCEGIGNGKQ